ncbi:hypothetical protein DFH29DRAFT_1080573 [Suillus ampliporus]|nr:hypothetical protein DFH29DRAFT_1080573 [Suillus ampliporus]
MSETPSPKPKPGSLRDRIAAFENANKSAAPAPGPAPRPKPSTLQSWKPKAPSPPQSPDTERKTTGMSASDAMESIGRGGSLKERMAALQGKGAFGGGAPPPILPKPADKPKWKPPRPVSPPADEFAPLGEAIEAQESPSPTVGDPDIEGEHEVQQDDAETEQDPEEEERQRRAAIAARMARLGGARVGMGPPLFVRKPAPKKPATPPPQSEEEEEALSAPEMTSTPAEVLNPPTTVKEEATDSDHFPDPTCKDSDSSSLSLADAPSNTASSRSMPVPAGPRRAAPPRKKAYKSPPTSQLPEVPVPAAVPEITEEAPDTAPTEEPAVESTTEPEPEPEVASREPVESPEQVPVPSSEQILVIGDVQKEIGEVGMSAELDTTEVVPADKFEEDDNIDADEPEPTFTQEDQKEEEQEQTEQEEEEVEEARRTRVAAKLSQMGAFNPLAGPPPVPRKESIPSPIARRDSVPIPPVPIEEPLDVEDEVNVDLEEVGESITSPPAAHIPSLSHVEAEPEKAEEAREVASGAAEFDDEPQPDLGTTRRVLYNDEMDEQERYDDDGDQVLNEPEAWVPASQSAEAHAFGTAILPPSSPPPCRIPKGHEPSLDEPIRPGTSARDEEAALTDAVDSAPSDHTHEVLTQELTPDQHQEDGEMAPARITRPIPPPPVNLSSKPSIAPPSPPPPPRPLYALQADEDRPESPAPRPVPPPVKSVKTAEEPPAPPPRIARRTSASVKSVDVEAPPTRPPVPISPRLPVRRPTSPPIITALPLIVPVPVSEDDAEREFSDAETPSQPQQFQEPEEEDEESVRRRTIAERVARLGGIRFGGLPVPTPLTRPTFPRAPPPTSIPPDEPEVDANEPVQEDKETEEDEAARKQRISAKLAGMGGMRFGMLPLGRGVAPTTTRRLASRQDDSENEDAALPVPAPAAPARRPLPPVEVDSEQEQSQTTSDDGVRVEMEESEIVEVYYSDADVRESVEVLPTPPPRSPPPVGRPPIPSIPASILNRRPSVATASISSSRKSSVDYSSACETPIQRQHMHSAFESVSSELSTHLQSEYVMVEPDPEAEEEPPAPPPRRLSRAPTRSAPPPPPPPPSAIDPPEEMASSTQWELPSIPQAASEFGDEGELASSGFSEDSTFQGSTPPSTRKSDSRRASAQTTRPADQELGADELMKSKRSLVGDGSYAGFVRAIFAQVPDAQRVSGEGEDWGYLIYVQTAGSVQRRVAEILPGDIIAFWDAKLKGYKGLHAYSQTVGTGENGPLIGVVSEVEGKKSKVRVWQANQHVGQQTVENVSYRLEDLKSGHVKVFRAMEV